MQISNQLQKAIIVVERRKSGLSKLNIQGQLINLQAKVHNRYYLISINTGHKAHQTLDQATKYKARHFWCSSKLRVARRHHIIKALEIALKHKARVLQLSSSRVRDQTWRGNQWELEVAVNHTSTYSRTTETRKIRKYWHPYKMHQRYIKSHCKIAIKQPKPILQSQLTHPILPSIVARSCSRWCQHHLIVNILSTSNNNK